MLTTARPARTAPTRATVTRHIDAPVDTVFSLLADVHSWPRWGPFTDTGAPATHRPARRPTPHPARPASAARRPQLTGRPVLGPLPAHRRPGPRPAHRRRHPVPDRRRRHRPPLARHPDPTPARHRPPPYRGARGRRGRAGRPARVRRRGPGHHPRRVGPRPPRRGSRTPAQPDCRPGRGRRRCLTNPRAPPGVQRTARPVRHVTTRPGVRCRLCRGLHDRHVSIAGG